MYFWLDCSYSENENRPSVPFRFKTTQLSIKISKSLYVTRMKLKSLQLDVDLNVLEIISNITTPLPALHHYQ